MHFVLSDFSVPHITWVAMFTFDDMPLTSVFISRKLFHYLCVLIVAAGEHSLRSHLWTC